MLSMAWLIGKRRSGISSALLVHCWFKDTERRDIKPGGWVRKGYREQVRIKTVLKNR